MIIINLTGGIGNQLFQYAFGRALSLKSNCELVVDISSYEWDKLRQYSLNVFNLPIRKATQIEINNIKKSKVSLINRILYSLLGDPIPYYLFSVIKEKSFKYDLNFNLFRTKNVYLEGYWQSEKYFKNIQFILQNELKVNEDKLSIDYNLNKHLIIHKKNSVSIHVRRGDYVSNRVTSEYHGICDMNYYLQAINFFEELIEEPFFFVFSDDKNYVKENFGNKKNVLVVENIPYDYEELLLMSTCDHNIIANSSFSWWGAWLNANSNKKVIAPKKWFVNNEMQRLSSDLLPLEWIKI
jgi:hypothetical protein